MFETYHSKCSACLQERNLEFCVFIDQITNPNLRYITQSSFQVLSAEYGLLYTFKKTWPWGKCYGSYGRGSRTHSQTEIYLGETPRTEMKEGFKKQRKIANPQISVSNDDLNSAPFSAWFTKRYQDTPKPHSIIVSLPIQHLCSSDFFFFYLSYK